MAITYVGSASNPADVGSNDTSPAAVTPHASIVSGDLVLMFAQYRANFESLVPMSISETGGQTWSSFGGPTGNGGNPPDFTLTNIFWCQFNGTWSAAPSVIFAGVTGHCGVPVSVVMHAFHLSNAGNTWAQEAALAVGDFYTLDDEFDPIPAVITGRTTTNASTVTIGMWFSTTWDTWHSPSGWDNLDLGGGKYVNTYGNDQTSTYMKTIKTSAGATGDCQKQGGGGEHYGVWGIVTFYETAASFIPRVSIF